MKKNSFIFIIFIFVAAVCFGQAPESPAVQKRRTDSLIGVLKKIPENVSTEKDTLRLNTLWALIKRIDGDTLRYYLAYGLKRCNTYSPLVDSAEIKSLSEIKATIKKDPFLYYYLKMKSRLLRIYGGSEKSDEDKLIYFLRSLKICEKTGDKYGLAAAYTSLSYIYNKQTIYSKAIENLVLALNIYKELGNKNLLADIYWNLGQIYHKQYKFEKALENYRIALEISKTSSNLFSSGAYYEYIGNCYLDMGNYAKAVENHFASLKVSEKLGDIKGVGDSYGDIASIYYKMNDFQNYRINAAAALSKYKEFSDPMHIAHAYSDLAEACYKLNIESKALLYLDSALKIYQKEKEDYFVVITFFSISEIYAAMHDDARSISNIEKGIELSKRQNHIELMGRGYGKLAAIYLAKNDYKTAYKYQALAVQMKDSLAQFGNETIEGIQTIQSKFDKERAEQEELLHKAVVAQKEAQISQEETQRYALYGGLFVLLLFGGFIFSRYKVSQKQQRIIEKQKQLVEEKNKEIRDSINYAGRIQRSFLATEELLKSNLGDYFVLFKPKDVVSGDFYWAGKLQNGNFALVTADSTGHGVPGAIMSILNISSLEKAVGLGVTKPSEILNHTRTTIIDRLKKDGSADGGKDGMDCSIICIDQQKQQLIFAAANNPVWIVRQNKLIEFKGDKMPVGKHDRDSESFTLQTKSIEKGDVIYTLTDGMPDQFGGPKGKKYKYKQLKELLISITGLSMPQQKEILDAEFFKWKGELEQVDDVCLIGIRI
ncbi:MAG: tetratricopeptide repeat protein [Bacteroidia bacterium]|nr:tetratricopeptide repeat protein [Bacteroidia bacterium]